MGTNEMHPGIAAVAALGWITPEQAKAADAYADELVARVSRDEISLEEAEALMAQLALVHAGLDSSAWRKD